MLAGTILAFLCNSYIIYTFFTDARLRKPTIAKLLACKAVRQAFVVPP